MDKPRETLPPGRQVLHYVGLGMILLGVTLFISVFVTGAMHFGDFSNFEQRARSESLRAITGMILMMIGAAATLVGRLGPAGSGLVPDPQRARRDVEPWTRAAGGMLGDVLNSVDVGERLDDGPEGPIRVRCRECQALNGETAKFCDQCGKPL